MLFDIGVKSCYWENLEIYKICLSNATKGKFAILFSNRQHPNVKNKLKWLKNDLHTMVSMVSIISSY